MIRQIKTFHEYKSLLWEFVKRDIKLNKEMLDDIISLLNIKSNRKGQNITIALTIITVILTAITIWISIKTVGS